MSKALQVYTLVINWDDDDLEAGNFGATVRARDPEHAERIVRAQMCWTHWRDHREPGGDRRESLSPYLNDDGSYFGSLVDFSEGAAWLAKDMEKALRLAEKQLVAVYGEPSENGLPLESVKGRAAILEARKVLAEIDKI